MQQGDNKMETADMTMNGCSLSGPGGAMENSTTHKNTHIRTLSFLVRFLQNLIKGHNLDPIRLLLKQKTDGSESAKKPGSGTLLRNSLVSDLTSD